MIVNNAPLQNSLLSLLKGAHEHAAKDTPRAKSDDATGALIDTVAKGDPDRAAALADEQAKLKDALAKLQTGSTDHREARKAAAREKIARIKAALDALKMAAGGDPKVVAKMAARLSHELAAAAKEYAAAGGGATSGLGGAATPPADANAPTNTETGANAEGGASADANTQTDVAHETINPDDVTQHDGGGDTTSEPAANEASSGPTSHADAAKPAGANERAQDEDFVRNVRQLMSDMKSIVEHQKHRMQIRGDGTRNDDIAEADTALKDTEDSLGKIAGGTLPAALGVNITI